MILSSRSLGRSALLSMAMFAVACGGGDDDGGDNSGVDGGINFFDSGPQIDGGTNNNCSIEANLGTIASLGNPVAGKELQDPQPKAPADAMFYSVFGTVALNDFFELDLWDGYGAFAGGEGRVATGTYDITGDDATVLGCGVCGFLFGDVNAKAQTIDQFFIATSGSITVDAFAETTVSGSGTNLVFSQFDENSETGELVPNGCSVSIPSITFSGNIPPPM